MQPLYVYQTTCNFKCCKALQLQLYTVCMLDIMQLIKNSCKGVQLQPLYVYRITCSIKAIKALQQQLMQYVRIIMYIISKLKEKHHIQLHTVQSGRCSVQPQAAKTLELTLAYIEQGCNVYQQLGTGLKRCNS